MRVPRVWLRAVAHAVVETQIAEGHTPACDALGRLTAAVFDRHLILVAFADRRGTLHRVGARKSPDVGPAETDAPEELGWPSLDLVTPASVQDTSPRLATEHDQCGETVMRIQRLLIALTLVNLLVLLFTIVDRRPANAQDATPALRGRSLEIVDSQGRVRASLTVLPAGKSANGDPYPETVLLRLITERGRPAVKISTSEESTGVSLAGPSDTRDTYVILEAKGKSTSLTMKNESGREHIVRP